MVDKELCEINHKNINDKIDRLEKRVDKLENVYEAINKLTLEVQRNVSETKQLRIEMNSGNSRLDELEDKPAKRYEELTKYVLFAIVGGIISYLLFQIGLK